MTRRSIQPVNDVAQRSAMATGWLSRFFDRLEARQWERERRELEDYLADSSDLFDLEDRIRRYDRRHADAGPLGRI